MRRFAFIAAAAACFAGAAAPAAVAGGSGGLSVMTWNVAAGPATKFPWQPQPVAATISGALPDVVALQEVCSWQAAALGRLLRPYGYGRPVTSSSLGDIPDRRVRSGACDFGNAILSRLPLSQAGSGLLNDPGDCRISGERAGRPECRSYASASADVPGAGPVRIIAVHLGPVRDWTRAEQVGTLALEAALTDGPLVIAGDWNTNPAFRLLRPLRASGLRAVIAGASFPSWLPVKPLDAAFARGLPAGMDPAAGFVPVAPSRVRPLSDHLPVLISWTPPDPQPDPQPDDGGGPDPDGGQTAPY